MIGYPDHRELNIQYCHARPPHNQVMVEGGMHDEWYTDLCELNYITMNGFHDHRELNCVTIYCHAWPHLGDS